MRKCPFCKSEVKFASPYLFYLDERNEWGFSHHCCNGLMVFITAETKEEILPKWDGIYEEPKSESV